MDRKGILFFLLVSWMGIAIAQNPLQDVARKESPHTDHQLRVDVVLNIGFADETTDQWHVLQTIGVFHPVEKSGQEICGPQANEKGSDGFQQHGILDSSADDWPPANRQAWIDFEACSPKLRLMGLSKADRMPIRFLF